MPLTSCRVPGLHRLEGQGLLRVAMALSFMLVVASIPWAGAQTALRPPDRVTYQGYLAAGDGLPLGATTPRAYEIIFRIHTAESGGSVVWAEQQTVTVDKGYLSVQLGEGGPVSGFVNPSAGLGSVFSGSNASDRYVGVTVRGVGSNGADYEVQPRVRLLSAPYAYLAQSAQRILAEDGSSLVSPSTNGLEFVPGFRAGAVSVPTATVGTVTVTNTLVLSGSVGSAGSGGGFVAPSEGSMRIISGRHRWSTNAAPNATGSTFATEPSPGYSIARTSEGTYQVTFDTPFASVPAVVVTPLQPVVAKGGNYISQAWASVDRTTNTSQVTIRIRTYTSPAYIFWNQFAINYSSYGGQVYENVNATRDLKSVMNQTFTDYDFQFQAFGP